MQPSNDMPRHSTKKPATGAGDETAVLASRRQWLFDALVEYFLERDFGERESVGLAIGIMRRFAGTQANYPSMPVVEQIARTWPQRRSILAASRDLPPVTQQRRRCHRFAITSRWWVRV